MIVDFVLINYHCGADIGRVISEIETTFPWEHTVTVIDNSYDNRGFSKAANMGSRWGNGDFIAFINPDLYLMNGWADNIIAALQNPDVAIAGARLNDGMPWPRDVSSNGIKTWVCGACYFVRRNFFELVGGFDEQFFFTYEETDLIKQAENMGFLIVVTDEDKPKINHIRHNTPFHDQQLRISREQYRQKWGL